MRLTKDLQHTQLHTTSLTGLALRIQTEPAYLVTAS